MKVTDYTPDHFTALAKGLEQSKLDAPLLRDQSFLDHYFAGNGSARLLMMMSESGEVCATLGSERLRVEMEGCPMEVSVLSSPFAFREGAFPLLMLHWMRECDVALVFPGNALLRDMIGGQRRWQRIPGLQVSWFNWDYPPLPGDSLLKRLAKPIVRRWARIDPGQVSRRIAATTAASVTISEVSKVDDDMVRCKGPFRFRLAETAAYFNWRFSTDLQYVRYRVFRILVQGVVTGFVILGEWKACVLVAHCDGVLPDNVAHGVLLAIAQVNTGSHRYRPVLLSSMHERMRSVFHAHGFKPDPSESPMFVARFKEGPVPTLFADGLVNLEFWDGGAHIGLSYRS